MNTNQTILIAGGGIGGLTTALFLHQAGYDVKVFESVREIRPLGVGINILPHAVARLYKLGLKDALLATGIQTEQLAFFTRHGARIWSEPRGIAAGYPVPQFSIHRGDLQMILLNAVIDRIGAENVLTGHHLADFEQDDGGVTARFIDRKTGETVGSYRGAVLIGADGVMSRVREIFYPDEGAPSYSGIFLWRGITESTPFLGGKTMVMIGHNTIKAVIYPVSKVADENGRSLLNWVADLPVPMKLPPQKEEWNRQAQNMDFVKNYLDWQYPWLNVYKLFKNTENIYEFP
ncbi:MAG: FAD-dependent monooxygenase, partial [Aggregatilineales bacterium]